MLVEKAGRCKRDEWRGMYKSGAGRSSDLPMRKDLEKTKCNRKGAGSFAGGVLVRLERSTTPTQGYMAEVVVVVAGVDHFCWLRRSRRVLMLELLSSLSSHRIARSFRI